MRSTDEQLQGIMKRADNIREKKNIKKRFYAYAVAVCACMVLIIAVFIYIPRMPGKSQDVVMQQYGSLLLSTSCMGYVAVGILALILGICGTLLCISRKELKQKEQNQNGH